MYYQNTQKLFILNIFSNSFTSSQTLLTRLSSQLLSHYFPEGNSQLPFQNTALLIPEKVFMLLCPCPSHQQAHLLLLQLTCTDDSAAVTYLLCPHNLSATLLLETVGPSAPLLWLCSGHGSTFCEWHVMGHYQCSCFSLQKDEVLTQWLYFIPAFPDYSLRILL